MSGRATIYVNEAARSSNGRELELGACLLVAAELREQVAAHARQEVVALKRSVNDQLVHQLESGGRAERHPHGNGSVQLHDRRPAELEETVVERHDPRPVGFLHAPRPRVAGRDRRLKRVRAKRTAELFGPLQRGQATLD